MSYEVQQELQSSAPGWETPHGLTGCQGAAQASCSLGEGEPGAKGDNTAEQGRDLQAELK